MRSYVIAVVALLAFPASAQEPDVNEFRAVLDAAFGKMAVAYLCRDEIGISHYQAARIGAEGAAIQIGMPRDEAVLAVDKMDKKFKADTRTENPKADAGSCFGKLNEFSHELDVAIAKVRTGK
ncbi:hypothetical protein ASD52_02085 [Ensifer sp. Root142]|uniref:hypothetical protein n=1 Tax=Ensifer sp. Root142 TaxID=1736461 RepID=UPI00070DD5F8|nr:hypothetical protein [Ensifer sp. Root142]KQY78658.1 hypothetical protein ASD52_02085 [Ensifer sp. Root142]